MSIPTNSPKPWPPWPNSPLASQRASRRRTMLCGNRPARVRERTGAGMKSSRPAGRSLAPRATATCRPVSPFRCCLLGGGKCWGTGACCLLLFVVVQHLMIFGFILRAGIRTLVLARRGAGEISGWLAVAGAETCRSERRNRTILPATHLLRAAAMRDNGPIRIGRVATSSAVAASALFADPRKGFTLPASQPGTPVHRRLRRLSG